MFYKDSTPHDDSKKDLYEEAAQQFLEQAPRSPEYVPDPIELEDHVPAHILEHPEDLVPAKAEAPIEACIPEVSSTPTHPLPPSFLSPRIRPLHTRAAMAQMRAAIPSTYHSLLPSGTPPLLPIPLHVPSTSRKAEIPEAGIPPWKRLLLTAPRPGCEVGESSAAAPARQPGPTMACSDRVAVRAEIEVLRRERLAYEQESIQTRKALARSKAYSRALEAQVTVLETQARRHEWQRQTADDFVVQHIMRSIILTICGEGRNERNESQFNIISCSKAQEYMSKGCHVFLANITSTKDEDKSKGKRLEDIPVIQEFP
nr:reverse transcriptase domain-containing protein [Tanacetum cinerariifolium]